MNDKALVSNMTTMTFEVTPDAWKLKDTALAASAKITAIATREDMDATNPVLRLIKGCVKFMEDSRQEVKAPVTKLGKDIDATAKAYIAELEVEEARLKELTAKFILAERAKQIEEVRQTGSASTEAIAGEGITATEDWDFEVEDEVKAFAASPGLFELKPKRAVIIAAAKAGFPMPFIKTWKTTGIRVKG